MSYFIQHSRIWGDFANGKISMSEREQTLQPMRNALADQQKIRSHRRIHTKKKDTSMSKAEMLRLEAEKVAEWLKSHRPKTVR